MKLKQISITSLLLFTALTVVSIGLVFEKQKSQLLVSESNQLKLDTGFIEVKDGMDCRSALPDRLSFSNSHRVGFCVT